MNKLNFIISSLASFSVSYYLGNKSLQDIMIITQSSLRDHLGIGQLLQIYDIAIELFAMHCSIGRGIRQKKIPREKWSCRKYSKLIVSLESPQRPECICFFLNAISSIPRHQGSWLKCFIQKDTHLEKQRFFC